MKRLFIFAALLVFPALSDAWGFYAHMRINRLAVFTLPDGLIRFYKANISYVTEHATDPDKRRYADTSEAARHYLDVEVYEENIDSIPVKWQAAVLKYGLPKLNANGILPWQIQRSYYQLVNAFKERDSVRILIHSSYLGHYLGDAHVPLHTTQNHNGQLTNQIGIHGFWESRLPELYAEKYNTLVGKAVYMEDPLKEAWKIIRHTHSLVDSVLLIEADLNRSFPAYRKYSYSERNHQVMKQYSTAYSKAYHDRMDHMVEKQMRTATYAIGSYWYSAWVDAGQPQLENLPKKKSAPAVKKAEADQYNKFKKGRIIGREL